MNKSLVWIDALRCFSAFSVLQHLTESLLEWVTRVTCCSQAKPSDFVEWLIIPHTNEWVMSHMKESCHIWTRHTLLQPDEHGWSWGALQRDMNESCHISHLNKAYLIAARRARVISRSSTAMTNLDHTYTQWVSRVTHEWAMSHMNESCHMWMSHVSYEWVMSHMNKLCHIWMSRVIYERVMSHINESCHTWISHVTYEWVMSNINNSIHIWRQSGWLLWGGYD